MSLTGMKLPGGGLYIFIKKEKEKITTKVMTQINFLSDCN